MINVNTHETKEQSMDAIVSRAVVAIKDGIAKRGEATVVLATGMTYIDVLAKLTQPDTGVDWSKVTCFHLDEYVGIDETNKGSFKRYLKEYFANKVSNLKAFHYVEGLNNPSEEVKRLGELIRNKTIDFAFAGIGNNGHLGFNEPPADFHTTDPYIVVDLDDVTKNQQFSQGWYKSIEDVPSQAITMTIPQILKSELIICAAFGEHKADIVSQTVNTAPTNQIPATVLQTHANCELFLDTAAAAQL